MKNSIPKGFLRATRTCFHFSGTLGAYVRMSWIDEKKGDVKVEICPEERMLNYENWTSKKDHEYIVWNEPIKEAEEAITQLNLPQKKYDQPETIMVNIGVEQNV